MKYNALTHQIHDFFVNWLACYPDQLFVGQRDDGIFVVMSVELGFLVHFDKVTVEKIFE